MPLSPQTDLLNTERQKSDTSLSAERDQMNVSISKARDKAERRTDRFVQEERVDADQMASNSRLEADGQRAAEREATREEVKGDWKRSDERLLGERREADKAVELERSRMDAAMDHERESKNVLMSQFIELERDRTDKTLRDERTRSDSMASAASGRLSDEIAEHSKTKVSLTTRDEFLAIVSHDLRNPIGAIYSCAEMLLEDAVYKKMDSETKHWIKFMHRNAQTSLRLISDLLDMERIVQGQLHVDRQPHSIADLVRETVESFVHEASAKNLLLRAVPSNLAEKILCDGDRVRQILSNLIGNAIKFTPGGGSVAVKITLTPDELQLSVRDTGSGIPQEKMERIFDRFAQLGSKDRRGLGLGLYISKMLVEAQGGRLWVHSKVGVGSTFYFSLPR